MTGECPSGTDRVAAAVADRDEWEIVVNVQGDEPLLSGDNIDALVGGLLARRRGRDGDAVPAARGGASRRSRTRSRWFGTRRAGAVLFAFPIPVSARHRRRRVAVATSPRDLWLSAARRWQRLSHWRRLRSNGRRASNSSALWRTESIFWFWTHRIRRHGVDTPEDLERVEKMMNGGLRKEGSRWRRSTCFSQEVLFRARQGHLGVVAGGADGGPRLLGDHAQGRSLRQRRSRHHVAVPARRGLCHR